MSLENPSNDFYYLLQSELTSTNTNNNDNICLITLENLTSNYITLECGHKFNYMPLYNEVIQQKTIYNNLETTILKINEIKCPYCRTINNKILPYIDMSGVRLIRGVNYPKIYRMKLHNCQWTMQSGKNKGCICNKPAFQSEFGIFCEKHFKLTKSNNIDEQLREIYIFLLKKNIN